MPQMMKAAVVRSFGAPLEINEVPVPTPGPGEVLVKIKAAGVCHTDLHAADGDWPLKPTPPFIPGHEGAGLVAAVGRGITSLKEGDAVGIAWLHDACGVCEWCTTGWETLCPHQHNSGYSVNGAFAEYALGSAEYVAHLPRSVNFIEAAPVLCAGVTVYKGIKETEVRSGEWIAISGVGGLGQLAIQYAKALGLQVVALDVSSDKLNLARSSGADAGINAHDADAVAQVVRVTDGGAHGIVVTAPSPAAFGQAIGMARRKGTVVLIGLPPGNFPTPIFDVVLKRITIRGSIVGTRQDLREALQFAAAGLVHSHIHTAALEDINHVFTQLRQGTVNGRTVLDLALPRRNGVRDQARGAAAG
jgi:alcohol dehydrogenase, propanol-preferring